jgi:hypothetical protein
LREPQGLDVGEVEGGEGVMQLVALPVGVARVDADELVLLIYSITNMS